MKRTAIVMLVGAVIALANYSITQKQENVEKVKIIYVYDAICGWCFGFSPTMAKLQKHFEGQIEFEVVSGGLKLGNGAGPIDVVAPYIKTSYQQVEKTCGVKFGDAFVNGTLKQGTMILNSLPPAIALAIVKEEHPERALEFAGLLHKMYYVDGIEPESDDAYGAYAVRIGFDESEFNRKMKDAKYLKLANDDFQRARDLGARSFPTVIIEKNRQRAILFSGYKDFESAKQVIDEKME